MNMNKYLDIAPEVQQALADGRPVVALESTIISHGMPYPKNVETALLVEQTLRDNGTLAYSQINHKTYYRPEDVQRIVSIVEDKRKEARFKGRTI